MYHSLFRITLLVTSIAIILAACAAPAPTLVTVTKQSAATQVPTEATNTLEPTVTQVVLGIVEGTIAFQSNRDGNDEI